MAEDMTKVNPDTMADDRLPSPSQAPKRRRPCGAPAGFVACMREGGGIAQQPQTSNSSGRGEVAPSWFNSPTEWEKLSGDYCIGDAWREVLYQELQSEVGSRVLLEYERRCDIEEVLPPKNEIFTWTRYCAPSDVKVIIVGQDPYHQPGQAHGLAFSVRRGIQIPPSLRNILSAVRRSYPETKIVDHGCLEAWAKAGVLLLNTTLTVRKGHPGSHVDVGWSKIVKSVLQWLHDNKEGLVFMLWGVHAQEAFKPNCRKHCVLKYSHPSPLSRKPFILCDHFKKANEYLEGRGVEPVDWQLPCGTV